MSIILRIGLVSVLVVTVTADFEYSENAINPLYRKIQQKGNGKLDFELVNENVKVRLERTDRTLSFAHELSFHVEGVPTTVSECNGFPGLWLKLPPKQSCLRKLPGVSKKPSKPKLFCYRAVNFDFGRDRNNKPALGMNTIFRNADDDEYIMIIMPLFVPPVEEVDIRHAAENNVLRNVCPIPLDQFDTEGLIPRKIRQEEKQYYIGDITWLKEVLPRAQRLEGKQEWYYPGPVIIERELYNKIIGLDVLFEAHAYGKEPKSHGPTPRILKTWYEKYML